MLSFNVFLKEQGGSNVFNCYFRPGVSVWFYIQLIIKEIVKTVVETEM